MKEVGCTTSVWIFTYISDTELELMKYYFVLLDLSDTRLVFVGAAEATPSLLISVQATQVPHAALRHVQLRRFLPSQMLTSVACKSV